LETKIFFIVLNSAQKQKIVCDIVEKCYLANKRAVVYAKDKEEANTLDQLLWNWKQSSFLPHLRSESLNTSFEEPIVITSQIEDSFDYNTLILLDAVAQETLNKFHTAIEFVEKYDITRLTESRERYKMYKANKYNIETMQPGEFLTFQLN
jgi:DNA polymerase-3 subunit chi